MTDLFVDTSGWAHGFVQTEPFYPQASTLISNARAQGVRLVTTNYVLCELTALLTSPVRLSRPRQIEILGALQGVEWIEIVHISRELDVESWNLLRARADKNWSWVDCSSFVVMQQRGITEALTTDHHFEQAGYVRLLK